MAAARRAGKAAAERRRDADRDENELGEPDPGASALIGRGLPTKLDGSLVKTRRLERTNREISEKTRRRDRHHPRRARCRRRLHEPHQRHHQTAGSYRMACEEGQEVRLLKARAENLESAPVESLRGKFGEIGDAPPSP